MECCSELISIFGLSAERLRRSDRRSCDYTSGLALAPIADVHAIQCDSYRTIVYFDINEKATSMSHLQRSRSAPMLTHGRMIVEICCIDSVMNVAGGERCTAGVRFPHNLLTQNIDKVLPRGRVIKTTFDPLPFRALQLSLQYSKPFIKSHGSRCCFRSRARPEQQREKHTQARKCSISYPSSPQLSLSRRY